MRKPIDTVCDLFARLWARYGANHAWPGDSERAARDYAQFHYMRGYERGRLDARNEIRRRYG